MARELDIDIRGLTRALETATGLVRTAARTSIEDIMDDWQRESVDLAPVDTAALRRSIHTRIKQGTTGASVTGTIHAKAVEAAPGWGNFNYAYYIHEVKGDSFQGRISGTKGRFLDIPAEQHEQQWIRSIEQEISRKIREAGF
jgi:hypothetical protein